MGKAIYSKFQFDLVKPKLQIYQVYIVSQAPQQGVACSVAWTSEAGMTQLDGT